ncbi:MAG: hypothetical protein GKR93_03610 [Gammaproteobacteria bacterium]|nr:hypothetical protein [Gammaproteobacteria bacterium]
MYIVKVVVFLGVLSLSACSSSDDDKASGEHVWKDQVATIDKAKDVEATLMKSAEDKAKAMAEQTQ